MRRGSSAPNFANWSASSLPSTPLCPGTQINLTLFCSASSRSSWKTLIYFERLHGTIFQKAVIFILATLRAWNLGKQSINWR
jgi:hypothetical protein